MEKFTILSLFTCHYSSVIVHETVHSEFCLFKGGCPLFLGQVFSLSFLSLRESFFVSLFLREFLISP